MTENQYIQATKIKNDLAAIRSLSARLLPKASKELEDKFKGFCVGEEARLLKEFEEL